MKRYIINYSLKSGLGNPSVELYLTGCDKPVKCKGCHNWEIQEESKEKYEIGLILKEIREALKKAEIFNKQVYLSILGGEPLAAYNKDITMQVAETIKEEFPHVVLVIYTWRELDEIKHFDFGVMGEYVEELHVDNYLPSSTNQYIYDFNKKERMASIKLKGE